jgi:hypothetical protein
LPKLARFPAFAARVVYVFVSEYRRLDAPPPGPVRAEISCTSAHVERAWQPYSYARRLGSVGFARPQEASLTEPGRQSRGPRDGQAPP